MLPSGSSHLPARHERDTRSGSRPGARLFGVAPGGGCRVSHPHGCPCLLVSVALFLALGARRRLLRTAVSRHPTLRSPDLPLPQLLAAAIAQLASMRQSYCVVHAQSCYLLLLIIYSF